MKNLPTIRVFAMAGILMLAFAACKDRGKDALEYDRAALTAQIADRLIVPAYSDLHNQAHLLQSAQGAFRAQPTAGRLQQLQGAFQDCWLGWKACSAYEFGPAASLSLRAVLNTFPSDTAQILTNVQSGAWDLNLASNIDARGFPALDFLLFRLGNDSAATLARFLAPADSAHLQGYVAALVTDVASVTSSIYQQWTNGYSATFKASLGTDVGSSTSLIVNEMNRDLEILKTASIGIPLGKQSFDTPLPDKVEGFYSGMSKSLAIAQLTTVRNIYNGEVDGTPDGVGLKEALDAVEAEYNGGALTDAIAAQFVATAAALQALPEPLSGAVVTNRVPVETAYAEVQKLVVLLKADLASALSILITYTDADGD